MTLTLTQQKKVEENMGLVGKVIKEKVHGISSMRFHTYDDLFQIGCIGLCKAVCSDNGSHNFSTYAYRLIWNEICDQLVYASKRTSTELLSYDTQMQYTADKPARVELKLSLEESLAKAKSEATPTVAKGIDALIMMNNGETAKEIGARLGASANLVTAWVSKARKFLQARPDIKLLQGEFG